MMASMTTYHWASTYHVILIRMASIEGGPRKNRGHVVVRASAKVT